MGQKAHHGGTQTSSETQEKEHSIRLNDLATARQLVKTVVAAERNALALHAAAVQQLIGDSVVVIVWRSTAVDAGDLHSICLHILLACCATNRV